jgi:hypothetical protein
LPLLLPLQTKPRQFTLFPSRGTNLACPIRTHTGKAPQEHSTATITETVVLAGAEKWASYAMH